MRRIKTSNAWCHVAAHEHFQNSSGSLRGYWHTYDNGERVYVVWTYNEPLFCYDELSRTWFGNNHKYSSTSSKHLTCAHPRGGVNIEWRDRYTMKEIANNGLAGSVRKQFREAA